jgi:hypothetical protein
MRATSQTSPTRDRYCLALGVAALDLWRNLPQDLQVTLFERAVVLGHRSERDESLREQLAKFLHDHHARTEARQGSDKAPLGDGIKSH